MNKNKNEIVQYFVVNSEVKMSTGKIAAQVAHAETMILIDMCLFKESKENIKLLWDWYNDYEQKKIILSGKEKDLIKLIDKGFYRVVDNGYTEIPKGTLTVVGLPLMRRSEAQKYIKRLQLL
jgi:PTH2 family peptidyl-tRNA hydrolase